MLDRIGSLIDLCEDCFVAFSIGGCRCKSKKVKND